MNGPNLTVRHTLVQQLLIGAGEILRREFDVSLAIGPRLSEDERVALAHIIRQAAGICRALALLARYGEQLPPFDEHMAEFATRMQEAQDHFQKWSTTAVNNDQVNREQELQHIQQVGCDLADLRGQVNMLAALYCKYNDHHPVL